MKKRLFTLIIAFAAIIEAKAQTTLTGTITDAHTGEALIGASIVPKSSKELGAVTDIDGHFTLVTHIELPLTLSVQFVGYRPQEVDVYEATEPFNQLRRRAGIAEVSAPTFDQIKREWDYEFTYEQFSLYNSLRWKDLITSVRKVSNYKHFSDDWQSLATYTSDQEAYFQKVHNHLVAKYNNVSGRHYRQPIPTGLSGEDLGITPQNPGY